MLNIDYGGVAER